MRLVGILAVLAATLTSACASVSYTEPAEGPRARVRFALEETTSRAANATALNPERAIVYGFSDANCNDPSQWMVLYNGYLVNSDPRSLGMPLARFHENGAKEFYVAADQPLNILFVGETPTYNGVSSGQIYCPVFASTRVSADTDYELVFRIHGGTGCSIEMSNIVTVDAGVERRPVRTFTNATSPTQGCVDYFNRQW